MAMAIAMVIDASQISSALSWPPLLHHLRSAFENAASFISPIRHCHSLPTPTPTHATLLLMPAWPANPNPDAFLFMGVKIVSVFPRNSDSSSSDDASCGAVSASYLLSSAVSGRPVAFLDGGSLTLWRTAAVSAIAADRLCRSDPKTFLMVGAGAMAPFLVRAHCSVRPSIGRILIWNRTHSRASAMAETLQAEIKNRDITISACSSLEEASRSADLICCATMSQEALIRGAWLRPGAHLDLVGSFRPDMCEADKDAICDNVVFVDTDAAAIEAGELVGLSRFVKGNLSQLLSGERPGRSNLTDITVFKSVGCALADLATAQLVYEMLTGQSNLKDS